MPNTFSLILIKRTRRAQRFALGVLALVLMAGSLHALRGVSESPAAKIYVVSIEGMKFSPDVLKLKRGDQVVFKNHDLMPHTATAKAKAAESFDSGPLKSDAEWIFTPTRAGTLRYACSFHPMMEGQLIVSAP